MKNLTSVLFFVALTFLCWGSYGPTLHLGANAMDHSLWRPFLCVGLAYFLVAVLFPLLFLGNEESGKWTVAGSTWSFVAGCIGAIGALGIVLAFKAGAKPIYVMPLVFGCAPVVNTLVTMFMNQTYRKVNIPFFLAIAIVALGAAGVMRYKPKPPKQAADVAHNVADLDTHANESTQPPTGETTDETTDGAEEDAATTDAVPSSQDDTAIFQWFTAVFSIVVTALCWGSYGPILHLGQARMQGSRLRPFICVGLAYFVIGVIVPAFVLMQFGEVGKWSVSGSLWSLAAGAAGAAGALESSWPSTVAASLCSSCLWYSDSRRSSTRLTALDWATWKRERSGKFRRRFSPVWDW